MMEFYAHQTGSLERNNSQLCSSGYFISFLYIFSYGIKMSTVSVCIDSFIVMLHLLYTLNLNSINIANQLSFKLFLHQMNMNCLSSKVFHYCICGNSLTFYQLHKYLITIVTVLHINSFIDQSKLSIIPILYILGRYQT